MVDEVDDDGSGQIEFPEFLSIMKGSVENEKEGENVNQFFKDVVNG